MRAYKLYLFIAATGLLLAACDKNEIETIYRPTLTVSSSAIVASSEGGAYSFGYTVANPADDGQLTVETAADWIGNVSDSGAGTVNFSVDANSADDRTGVINLSYVSSYGTISETVTVVQYAGYGAALLVQPMAVTVSYEGGDCSFSYTLSNVATDGELTCRTEVDWITDFDYSSYGTVGFSVAQNSDGDLRSAKITVTYVSSTGEVSGIVTVVQDYVLGGYVGSDVDISDLLGTYILSGQVVGSGYTELTATTWTAKLYAYDGFSGYDLYLDGLVPWTVGAYDNYGDHRASVAGFYQNGIISIPSQITGAAVSISSTPYYLGFTPCVDYIDDTPKYDSSFPSLVIMYDPKTDSWNSNYGVILGGCTESSIYSLKLAFQTVTTTFSMVKVADTTSLTTTRAIAHPIDEGLVISNITCR